MERQAKIRTFFLTPAEVINGIFRKLYYSQERYYCGKKKNDLMMSSRGRLERESEIKQRGDKEGREGNRLHSTPSTPSDLSCKRPFQSCVATHQCNQP